MNGAPRRAAFGPTERSEVRSEKVSFSTPGFEIKVAVLTPSWTPVPGGVARFSACLVRELRRNKDTDVVVLAETGEAQPGVRIEKGGRRHFIRAARRTLEAERPDAVHCHSNWFLLRSAVSFRRNCPRTRLIFSFHTDWERPDVLRRKVLEWLLSKCDFLTFVSWRQAATIANRFRLRSPFLVVPPGGDTEESLPSASVNKLPQSLAGFKPLLAFVGALQYRAKAIGVAALIEALPRILAHHPNIGLAIAGDGAHRQALEAKSREQGVQDRIAFLGWIRATRPLLEACDIYVHPSLQEGMPLAVLEAMYLGRPIVATRAGGIPEALADGVCGVLVGGAAEEFASAIDRIVANPDMALRLGSEAQARAQRCYRWARAADEFASLYGVAGPSRVHVSVDVEADFPSQRGDTYRGVTEGLPRILDLLRMHRVPASFFVTLDCLERFPDLAADLSSQGFSVGSHGSHRPRSFGGLPMEEQVRLLRTTATLIEDRTGRRPVAFRAPNFDASRTTFLALAATGYTVDSSLLPGRLVRRWRLFPSLDHRGVPLTPFRVFVRSSESAGGREIIEVPVSPNPMARGGPVGLGFLHSRGLEATLQAIDASPGRRAVFLVHPWEAVDLVPSAADPRWVTRACSSDLTDLDDCLARLSVQNRLATLDDEIRSAVAGDG